MGSNSVDNSNQGLQKDNDGSSIVGQPKNTNIPSVILFIFGLLLIIWGLFVFFGDSDGWNFLGILPLGIGSLVCLVFASGFSKNKGRIKSVGHWGRVVVIGILTFCVLAILAFFLFA